MRTLNATLARQANLAPLILRLVLGALFLYHGIDKFDTGLANVEGFFTAEGVPLPGLTTPFTAIAEIVIGVALIAGIGTRIAAAVGIVILAGAMAYVKLPDILGSAELDLAYIAGLFAVLLLGPGRLSIDEALQTDHTHIDLRDRTDIRDRSEERVGASV